MKTYKEFIDGLDLNEQTEITVEDGLKQFLDIAKKAIKGNTEYKALYSDSKKEIVAKKGNKYYKIINRAWGKDESVHGFVDATTGDILKAAGWAAPAKGARGNITDPVYLAKLKNGLFDVHGGYLYR